MGFSRPFFLWTSLIFLAFWDSSAVLPTCNKCCSKGNHVEIDEPRRSTQNVWKPGQPALCDRTLSSGWYRFIKGEMPTKKVPPNHCGTMAPIWLNGNLPTAKYKTVARSACVNVFGGNNGCAYSFAIYIRKCGLYYVYYLGPTHACSVAYCAGNQQPCPNGKMGRHPNCHYPPVQFSNDYLKDPVISFRDGKDDQSNSSVTLLCKVSILKGIENWKNVTYQMEWFSEGKKLKGKTFCQAPPNRSTANTCPNRKELVSPLFGDEYKVGQRITCNVTAKFTTSPDNVWSLPRQVQHPFFAGIKVYPTSFTLEQCAVIKEITITPTIPVRKNAQGKGLAIYFWLPPEMMLVDDTCKIELSGTTPVKIGVLAKCTTFHTTGRQKVITPKILDLHSSFWVYTTGLPTIWVYLKEKNSEIHKCKTITDPHYRRLDKINVESWFDFMGQGDFILYHNKERSFEVQTRQWVCNVPGVTCNCGAALRYFNDVIEFSCCNPNLYHDTTTPMKVKIRSKKCLGRGISITQVINGFNSKYEVLIPAGIKVELERNYWGIDVTIFTPRAQNPANEKGLCLYKGTNVKNKVDAFGYTQRLNPGQSLFDALPQQVKVGDMLLGKACSCIKDKNKKPECRQGIPVLFPTVMKQKMSKIAMCDRLGRDIQGSDDLRDEDFELFVSQTYINEFKVQKRSKRALAPPPVSKKNATRYCNEKLAETDVGKLCAKLGTNVQALVNTCSADIEYTGDFSYAIGAVALLMSECGDVAARNGTFFRNESSEEKPPDSSIVEKMSQLLCPNDCTFNGKCENGSCVCNKDFTAQDCSISVYQSPDISKLQGNGLCDRRKRPCKKVTVMGNGFLDSKNITCHIEEFKVVNGSWTPNNTELKLPGIMTDLVLVDCYLPVSPVMQSPYDGNQEGTPAAGLMISVSNNGVHKSTDKLKFISFDSACMECNVSTGCFLKNNSCFINRYCFVPNEANPKDWCYQCLPDVDTNSWTKRQVNLAPRFTSNTSYFALYQEQVELMIETSDPEGMPVTISMMEGSPNGSAIQDNVISWKVATNKTTNFYLKATDACNASSTLVIDISIVVCQCKNDGKCLPHPQKPRGSGFYECNCAPGYTGDMCDTDIDDCLSYPCSRGRCVDMINNYTCICDPGYVGRNCDNDYDDCKSSPCAHGNCTDHVGGYTCSCEAGYTGDICNIDIDECQSAPCQNGNCTDIVNGFYCSCDPGFTGKTCETNIQLCQNASCYSGVLCATTVGGVKCGACPSGMTGDGISCFGVPSTSKVRVSTPRPSAVTVMTTKVIIKETESRDMAHTLISSPNMPSKAVLITSTRKEETGPSSKLRSTTEVMTTESRDMAHTLISSPNMPSKAVLITSTGKEETGPSSKLRSTTEVMTTESRDMAHTLISSPNMPSKAVLITSTGKEETGPSSKLRSTTEVMTTE